jgi:hypothetical protein
MISSRSRYRLLTNILVLALALGALAASPSPAYASNPVCSDGCVAWDAQNGCTTMMSCCVNGPDDWVCISYPV